MNRFVAATILCLASLGASAQMTPVGLWKTISDADGKPQSEVRVTEFGGVLVGTVEKSLTAVPNPEVNCDKCTDDRKGKPKIGMQIVRGAKKTDGKEVWEGGNILDPNEGKIYQLKMTPLAGGKKLEVRGFVGISLLGRSQTWVRVE